MKAKYRRTVVHFRRWADNPWPECGAGRRSDKSGDVLKVTCGRCKKTATFKNRVSLSKGLKKVIRKFNKNCDTLVTAYIRKAAKQIGRCAMKKAETVENAQGETVLVRYAEVDQG